MGYGDSKAFLKSSIFLIKKAFQKESLSLVIAFWRNTIPKIGKQQYTTNIWKETALSIFFPY